MGYNQKKAEAYNKLIQSGISESEALSQAGIGPDDDFNYSIGDNGLIGPLVLGSGLRNNEVIVRDQPPQSTYPQTAARQVTAITKTSTQTDSTTAVSGGGTTTIISGQPIAGPKTAAAEANAAASQTELDQFIKDNPSNLARKRQGLPPLTPEENEAREAKRRELEDQITNANNQVADSKTPGVPTIINTPNTTTTTRTVEFQNSVEIKPVQYTTDPELEDNQEEQFDNENNRVAATEATDVNTDENDALRAAAAEADAVVAENNQTIDDADPFEAARLRAIEEEDTEPRVFTAEDLGVEEQGFFAGLYNSGEQYLNRLSLQAEDAQDARAQANADRNAGLVEQARAQNERKLQRKNVNDQDWRVRLRLAPQAKYLYNAPNPGPLLQPLALTDGVIFPYTPRIETNYKANYSTYDLTHSNYRGAFYQNSYADAVTMSCPFTAQDTTEADYLLGVIHFFRSATKMFYGQDPQRGAPPPLVFLSGLGQYQFNGHPCVITNFTYTLPSDVDYIRAGSTNINGANLLTRRNRQDLPTNPISGAVQRLKTLGQAIFPGAVDLRPAPQQLQYKNPTYVPTKIDITISLLPVQTRSQVSQQFSLQGFANGDLLKGGFW